LQEALGIRNESVFKAASGLHGGMGKGDVCGSLMGSILTIGLICGKSIDESAKQPPPPMDASGEHPEPDTTTRLVGELYDWFGEKFGSVKCNDIRTMHEEEVDRSPDAGNLTPDEKLQRMHARCDELCSKTAARAVKILWEVVG